MELNTVLNLNIQTLVINRKNVLDFAIRKLTDGLKSILILKKVPGCGIMVQDDMIADDVVRVTCYVLSITCKV